MYLKKLTLAGFKSFADPTEFTFDRRISVVVGPNGCGKSNVVDAFRWVLGERSAKGLRGQEMLDVIFKGTRRRAALGRAEVTLLFDNSSGRLAIDSSEVEVGRRLYRSGESEYIINRRRCRLKDVRRLFSGTGLGADGYSILEQGNVDSFLHASPQDRRVIFEHAAGISHYKEQTAQTLRQLERTEANLARLRDILNEVERRVRSVKIQAGKARRYLEDQETFLRLRAVLAVADLENLRRERGALTFRLQKIELERSLLASVEERLENERGSLKETSEAANAGFSRLRDEAMQIRIELERIEQRTSHIEERQEELIAARDRRGAQLSELAKLEGETGVRREASREHTRQEIAGLRELRRQRVSVETERVAIVGQKKTLESSVRDTKERLVSLLFAETDLSNERTALDSEARSLEALGSRRLQEREEFDRNLGEQDALRRKVDEDLDRCRREAGHADADLDVMGSELDIRLRRLTDAQRMLGAAQEKVARDQARLGFLEELEASREGIGPGARRLLAEDHPIAREVLGLLASCIDAEREVAPMVDAVLGRFTETVVLRGDAPLEDRARVLQDLLRGEGVTFCQVSQRNTLEDVLPASATDDQTPLLDLISCHPRHAPLMKIIFGDVFVVDAVADAIRLRSRTGNRRRYVTPSGILVEPWGAVVLPSRNGTGLVSRRAEIHQLRGELVERERKLAYIAENAEALELSIAARQGERRRLEAARERVGLEIESHVRQCETLARDRTRLEERRQLIVDEIAEIEASRERALVELRQTADRFESARSERGELEEAVEQCEEDLSGVNTALDAIDSRLSELRVKATQREERLIALRREGSLIESEIRERRERRQWLEMEQEREEAQAEAYGEEQERLAQESESEREKETQVLARITAAREELSRLKEALEKSEACSVQAREFGEELRGRRETDLLHENECQLRITNIREKFLEEFDRELTEVPIAEWRDSLRSQAPPESGERAIAAAGETSRRSPDDDDDESRFHRALRERLQRTQERLRKNTNVNMEAVNELEELEDRQEFLATQITDLEQSRDRLQDTIDELNKKSREVFLETFEVVRNHYRDIFHKMFEGGLADLTLEEGVDVLEAGVEVKARPPGKRISSLRLLSGGEKALTAISVLFALFRTRPSPFCLLDEVDAPLDEANINRFIRALQDFTANTQFVVITHSKVTMSQGEVLYGVTMEEEGVSRKVAVRLDEVDRLGIENDTTDTTPRSARLEERKPHSHPAREPADESESAALSARPDPPPVRPGSTPWVAESAERFALDETWEEPAPEEL